VSLDEGAEGHGAADHLGSAPLGDAGAVVAEAGSPARR
jgi:hypothetical protein